MITGGSIAVKNKEKFLSWLSLYGNNKIDDNKAIIYLALKNENILGFCLNMLFNNSLIMKTIAVDEEWQQMGVANAMVHKTHNFALDNKMEKVI